MRKNIALKTFIFSLAVIFISSVYIFSLRNDNTFRLEDIEGDRNALSDLVITGYVQDRHHGNKFTISSGHMEHRFEYYDNTNYMRPGFQNIDTSLYGKYHYSRDYDYEIARDARVKSEYSEINFIESLNGGDQISGKERITITYTDKIDIYMTLRRHNWPYARTRGSRFPEPNYIKFKTDISIQSDEMEFKLEEKERDYDEGGTSISYDFKDTPLYYPYPSNINNITEVNGVHYLTVHTYIDEPSNNRCIGEGGIYRVEEYGHWFGDEEVGRVEKIVSIDLDGGKTKVLGLHSVNNRLVLLLVVDDILILRSYDPTDGSLMGELPIPNFEIEDNMCIYEVYIEGNILTLDFSRKDRYYDPPSDSIKRGKNYFKVLSVEVGEDMRLLHSIDNFSLGNRSLWSVANMVPVDGKLTIIANLQEENIYEIGESIWDRNFLYPIEFTLFVFDASDGGELLYEGRIVTDAHEDSYMFRQGDNTESNYIGTDRNRGMAGIKVKGADSHD